MKTVRISAINADGSHELLWSGEVGLAEKALGDALVEEWSATRRHTLEMAAALMSPAAFAHFFEELPEYEYVTLVCRKPGYVVKITGLTDD